MVRDISSNDVLGDSRCSSNVLIVNLMMQRF